MYLPHGPHPSVPPVYTSQGTSILQKVWEIAFASLEIGVSANVLLLDVDVGDGCLAIDFFQCGLDCGSIIW
jgi:hypothetical protein